MQTHIRFGPYRNYRELLSNCLSDGYVTDSRLGETKELRGVAYSFAPGDAVYRSKISEPLMWCEMLQLLGGVFDPAALAKAAPNANHAFFTAQMAYGPRIMPQVPTVANMLAEDPSTRRAIILLPDKGESEPPCTIMIQFFLRHGRLETDVIMRSWDLWFGLPYDIIMFGGLARAMAAYLNYPCGRVEVHASSAHLYKQHWNIRTDRVENIPGYFTMNYRIQYPWSMEHFWSSLSQAAVDDLKQCPWTDTSPSMVTRAFGLRGSPIQAPAPAGVRPEFYATTV